ARIASGPTLPIRGSIAPPLATPVKSGPGSVPRTSIQAPTASSPLGQERPPLAAPLAAHHERALAEVDVRQVERRGLRPPQRRAGENREEGAVAGAAGGAGV